MNDRLITVAGTLIAMLLIVGMFMQPSANAPVTLPTSVEVGPNGYRGLAGWITSEGIPVVSHTEKFDALGKIEGTGHLLVTTVPHQKIVSQDEAVELLRWVALGNGLVILAALDDTRGGGLLVRWNPRRRRPVERHSGRPEVAVSGRRYRHRGDPGVHGARFG